MHSTRRRIVTAVLTLLATAGGWTVLSSARIERPSDHLSVSDWQPRSWYQVDDLATDTTLELPAGQRFRLVLGCLGEPTNEYRVSLSLQDGANEPGGLACRPMRLVEHRPTERRLKPTLDAISTRSAETILPVIAPREFFLHVTDGSLDDPKQYARITARNASNGARVRVFLDQQLAPGEVSSAQMDRLVQLLESEVLPLVESQFGSLRDVDGDGGLTVLLTPWLSRLQGGRTSIGGMVRSSDFQPNVLPPLGNRCDLLFLNSSLPSDDALRDLVSHEVAHAACLSQRWSPGTGSLRDEEDWLSEGLAHLAEPGWSNLDHRLAEFLGEPSRFPLVVPDYYRAGLWRNHGCRGATYLFARWCVDRNGSRPLQQLARSEVSGVRNLERHTGQEFSELFRDWSLSLADGREFESLDLRRVLNRLKISGVRPAICHSDSDGLTQRVRGTAFAVVDVQITAESARTLRIAADSAAKWQISICRVLDESDGPF